MNPNTPSYLIYSQISSLSSSSALQASYITTLSPSSSVGLLLRLSAVMLGHTLKLRYVPTLILALIIGSLVLNVSVLLIVIFTFLYIKLHKI